MPQAAADGLDVDRLGMNEVARELVLRLQPGWRQEPALNIGEEGSPDASGLLIANLNGQCGVVLSSRLWWRWLHVRHFIYAHARLYLDGQGPCWMKICMLPQVLHHFDRMMKKPRFKR